MLASLTVKGFAIIDELDIEFKDGLNVITGETGAGKSIIINALASLLIARTPTDVVRGASEHAEVIGQCFQGGEEYILRRVIGTQGRSRAFVNDAPVTAKRLEELGEVLIHVYGQNESQQLLSKETYVGTIDRFLGLQKESESLAEHVRRLAQVRHVLEAGKAEAEGQVREIDLLTYQLDEIKREDIKEGEEGRIRERLKVLRDAARIRNSLESIERALYEDEQSVHAALGVSSSALRPFAGIEWMEGLKKRIETLTFDVEDVVEIREGPQEDPRFRAGRAGRARGAAFGYPGTQRKVWQEPRKHRRISEVGGRSTRRTSPSEDRPGTDGAGAAPASRRKSTRRHVGFPLPEPKGRHESRNSSWKSCSFSP